MTRRALILGTLAGQVDAMASLQDSGWEVHACGHERQGPGVDAADAFHLVDILDVDAVASLCVEHDVDLLYSVGSDIAMPTVAAVNERLGLPGFHDVETTEILHRKPLLRAFLAEHDLSPVWSQRVTSGGDDVAPPSFPVIVKPSDSQGQRGITIVEDAVDLPAAITTAVASSRSDVAIVEELLDGPEVSVHVVVVDGEVRLFLPSDRHVWEGPLVGIPQAHVMPSRFLDGPTTGQVRELVDDVVDALGVLDGPLYFQLILTGDGPRIVEIAPRLDGCHLWRLVRHHLGLDLMAAIFRLLADDEWDDVDVDDATSHTLGFFLGSPLEPFRRDAHPPPDGGEIVHLEYQVAEGELPRATNDVVARLGYWIREDA